MNDLIKVNYDSDTPTVSGRELHEFLGVKTDYKDWFPRMCEYGFTEGESYCSILSVRSDGKAGRQRTDHALTIEMAKEICMLQRNDKGKQARQYFISLEKAWNSPEMVMKRALEIADRNVKRLQQENTALQTSVLQKEQIIGELKPKADYTDKILQSKSLVTITQIAKDYGMSGAEMNRILHEMKIQYKQSNQWLLYRTYQGCGYTHSNTIDITRSNGLSDVQMQTKWTQKGRLFLYDKLKERGILPMIEK